MTGPVLGCGPRFELLSEREGVVSAGVAGLFERSSIRIPRRATQSHKAQNHQRITTSTFHHDTIHLSHPPHSFTPRPTTGALIRPTPSIHDQTTSPAFLHPAQEIHESVHNLILLGDREGGPPAAILSAFSFSRFFLFSSSSSYPALPSMMRKSCFWASS